MSFWGATVITNLLSPFPSLVEWICGGYCVQQKMKSIFIFFLFTVIFCFTFWTNEFLGSYSNYKFIISFSIFSRMDLWRILCSQSNIEEVLSLSFSTPFSNQWFS